MAEQSFVMEIADLLFDRRVIEFEYGGRKVQVTYNPGAFTRNSADAEAEADDRKRLDVIADALASREAERFLEVEGGAPVVADADGLATVVDGALRRWGQRRDLVIDALANGLLVEWPIVEHGEPVEIDGAALASLPYVFVAECYGAIMDDMTPGKNLSRGKDRRERRRR